MGLNSGGDEWYPIGRRTVLKSTIASGVFAGGLSQVPGARAAAEENPFSLEELTGKPDYPVGEKVGFFVWYEEPRIHVWFNGDGGATDSTRHYVYGFDIQVDGGKLSDLQTESWNQTETISKTDTRIHGRGYVTSGDDGFSFAVDDFDEITLDLQQSDPYTESADFEEKLRRVENAELKKKPEQVYLGGDSTNPSSLPVIIGETTREPDLTIERIRPVQVVFDPNPNDDDTLDFVKDKATAVLVYPGGKNLDLLSDSVKITVEVLNDGDPESVDSKTITVEAYRALVGDNDQLKPENGYIEFRVEVPTTGLRTVKVTIDPDDEVTESDESNTLTQTISVAETKPIKLVNSRISPPKIPGLIGKPYGKPSKSGFKEHVVKSNEFIKATFPVAESNFISKDKDGQLTGVRAKGPSGILTDLLKIEKLAHDENNRDNPNNKPGVGITTKDYWKWKQNFIFSIAGCDISGNRGASNPGVSAMITTVDFWTVAAHELGHLLGLYVDDTPEEYLDNFTDRGSGYWVERSEYIEARPAFMEGIDIEGYDDEKAFDRWISNEDNYFHNEIKDDCSGTYNNVSDQEDFDVLFQKQLSGSLPSPTGSGTATGSTTTDTPTSNYDGNIIYLRGLVKKDGTLKWSTTDFHQKGEGFSGRDGDYTVIARDSSGESVVKEHFDISFELTFTSGNNESVGGIEIETGPLGFPLEYPVEVRSLELQENGEIIASFQTTTKLLRDAIDRIPDGGFRQEGDESEGDEEEGRRKALHNKVDAIEQMLEEDDEQGARQTLENDLKQSVKRWLKDDYETPDIDDISKDELLTIIDAHIKRLG